MHLGGPYWLIQHLHFLPLESSLVVPIHYNAYYKIAQMSLMDFKEELIIQDELLSNQELNSWLVKTTPQNIYL